MGFVFAGVVTVVGILALIAVCYMANDTNVDTNVDTKII